MSNHKPKHLVIGGIHVGGDQHVPCDVFEFGHLKLGARLGRHGVFGFNQVVVAINVFGDDVPAFEVEDVGHAAPVVSSGVSGTPDIFRYIEL